MKLALQVDLNVAGVNTSAGVILSRRYSNGFLLRRPLTGPDGVANIRLG